MLNCIKSDNSDVFSKNEKQDSTEKRVHLNGHIGKDSMNLDVTTIANNDKNDDFVDGDIIFHVSNENETSDTITPKQNTSTVSTKDFSFVDDTSQCDIKLSLENLKEKEPLNSLRTNSKHRNSIPSVIIPGEFDFIDGEKLSSSSINYIQKRDSSDSGSKRSIANERDVGSKDINDAALQSIPLNRSTGAIPKNLSNIPNVVIPGDFDFIDGKNKSSLSINSIPKRDSNDSGSSNGCRSDISSEIKSKDINGSTGTLEGTSRNSSAGAISKCLMNIPNVVIPGDFAFIDDKNPSLLSITPFRTRSVSDSESRISNASESNVTQGSESIDKNGSALDLKAHRQMHSEKLQSLCPENLTNVVIPGNFDFMDDSNVSSISRERLHSTVSTDSRFKNSNGNGETAVSNSVKDDSALLSHNTKALSSNNTLNLPQEIPSVVIPGDFDFIDEAKASSLTLKDKCLINGAKEQFISVCHSPNKSTKSDSLLLPTPSSSSPIIFKIPSIYLPSNVQYIDDFENFNLNDKKLLRGERTHSSFKIPRSHSTKRRLCRYHSDSETKTAGEVKTSKPKHHRNRSRKVKRSVSAIETNKDNYRTSVRRSHSERSGMIIAGKHLRPPGSRCRPHSHYEGGSSRCSSTKTLSTNVSISEIVAVEMGLKDIPGLTAKEARRRRMVCTVVVVTVIIAVVCVLLVVLTLFLSPEVDAILRKGNEEIYRSMAAGASTSSPTTEGSTAVVNNSAPPSGSPG